MSPLALLRRTGSVQSWLPAERVHGGALLLSDGGLRAVLECSTLAFGLKGEAEQRAVMHAWSGLLNSLPHPLQFLIQTRNVRPSMLPGAGEAAASEAKARLSDSYRDLLARMSSAREVVSRRFFVIVPVDDMPASQRLRRSRHLGVHDGYGVLDQRVRWISEWLRRIDLEPHRLAGRQLADLLYQPLVPGTAAVQPLADSQSFAGLGDLIAPAAIEELPGELRLDGHHARTLAVSHYPQRLHPGWLDALHAFEGDLDVALHVEPAPGPTVMTFLTRRIAELSSTVRLSEESGRRADPYRRAALEDAEELQDSIARGDERLFDTGLYLTVWSRSSDELEAATRRLEALLGSKLIHSRRLIFQAEPALISTLPLGRDEVRLQRSLSTSALAATFPFTGNDLTHSRGQLYGLNPEVRSPLILDRFSLENHNAVVFATSGAGKSFWGKTELLRSHVAGTRIAVIDPEGEYAPLIAALGGEVIVLRPGGADQSPVALDPLAVPASQPGALSERIATLLTLAGLLVGGLSTMQRAAMEEALAWAYAARGYTDDGDNEGLTPPTLAEVWASLERQAAASSGDTRSAIEELHLKLARYVHGSGRWLFTPGPGPSQRAPLSAYVLAGLPEEERAPAMFCVLDRVWSQLPAPPALGSLTPRSGLRGDPGSDHAYTQIAERTLVLVDEAWWLMQYPDTARFLFRLAKTARKRRAGLTLVTQDVTDVLASPLGETLVTNAALQVLMKQAPQALARLAELFRLTATEQSWLLNASRGEGLLMAQGKRVPFALHASEEELRLIKSGELGEQQ